MNDILGCSAWDYRDKAQEEVDDLKLLPRTSGFDFNIAQNSMINT
jgi:hypothetical protein